MRTWLLKLIGFVTAIILLVVVLGFSYHATVWVIMLCGIGIFASAATLYQMQVGTIKRTPTPMTQERAIHHAPAIHAKEYVQSPKEIVTSVVIDEIKIEEKIEVVIKEPVVSEVETIKKQSLRDLIERSVYMAESEPESNNIEEPQRAPEPIQEPSVETSDVIPPQKPTITHHVPIRAVSQPSESTPFGGLQRRKIINRNTERRDDVSSANFLNKRYEILD